VARIGGVAKPVVLWLRIVEPHVRPSKLVATFGPYSYTWIDLLKETMRLMMTKGHRYAVLRLQIAPCELDEPFR
jgi:hypothetical protein